MSPTSEAQGKQRDATVNVTGLFLALEDRLAASFEHEITQLRSTVLDLSRRVDALSHQIAAMERDLGGDVLDALVQVTQHLEAVQAASSWALLNELGRAPADAGEEEEA